MFLMTIAGSGSGLRGQAFQQLVIQMGGRVRKGQTTTDKDGKKQTTPSGLRISLRKIHYMPQLGPM